MRKFILYCLQVIAISGIISWLFYAKIDVTRVKEKDLSALDYSIKSHEYNDFIFIGASRVREHVDPFVIDSVSGGRSYNLSIDGLGVVECNLLVNEYLKNHPKPKVIFLNIDYNMFFTNGILYNMTDYFSYLKDSSVNNCLSPYRAVYRSKLLQQGYVIQEMFGTTDWSKQELIENPDKKEINYHLNNATGSRGFVPEDGKWTPDAERVLKDRMKVMSQKEGYDLLVKIIETCRRDSVAIIFLNAPSYYRSAARVTNRQEITDKVNAIASHYNVPTWDYSDMSISRSTNYFSDPFHLNNIGANIYSHKLAEDIKQKFYENSSPAAETMSYK